jgi:hypothetical protein
MDILNTFKNKGYIQYAYVALDNAEGSSCVGHWFWECALFLPDIQQLQKTLPYKLKILLHEPKKYKTNTLSDFGFYHEDIVYSKKKENDKRGTGTWQENHVIPEESEYLLYLPKFFYLHHTNTNATSFLECLNKFRNHYIEKIPNTAKTIPITYIARSLKENYKSNYREFNNKKEIRDMLVKMV